ncbi:hypothetical protein L0M14_00265 [Paenibacillus hexagrammi]|uniref:Uncharacterized protein n=1 Tax=Paenibacillus hexagrammi TaxID=2908839 RepID=A0ABY3SJ40_9BACL|nr:hypothetical protein [Paenibacillus sp. YPD9-1]UJF33739.1 hypothetical protein L0M14_00265 [Paenibacillus sp. YPD9-1]
MKSTTPVSKIKTEFTLNEAFIAPYTQIDELGGGKVYLEYGIHGKNQAGGYPENHLLQQDEKPVVPLHRIFLYLLIGERLFHFRCLQNYSLLRLFLGGRCPHHSLPSKVLIRLGKENSTIRDELQTINRDLIRPCLPPSLILDLDSNTSHLLSGN